MLKGKKLFCFIAALILCLSGCNNNAPIQEDVLTHMKINNIEKCSIKQTGNYNDLLYTVQDISVTQTEIEEYINNELESYEELIEIKDRKVVEAGDFVNISYVVYYNGIEVNNVKEEILKVGAGYFNAEMESALIGANLGEAFETRIIVPEDDDNKELAGKTEKAVITVNKIQYMKTVELTDEFVQEYYNKNDIDDFRKSIKGEIEEQKKVEASSTAKEQLVSQVKECFEYDLDNDDVLNYALTKYNEYEEMARGYGADMEEFVSDFFGKTLKDFYDSCYEKAEDEIKEMLIFGTIALDQGLSISQKSMNEKMADNNNGLEHLDEKEISSLKYQILRDGVLEYLISTSQNQSRG